MRKQQEDSEKDSKWLRQQEENIKKRLSISSLTEISVEGIQNPIKPITNDKGPLSPKMNPELQSNSASTSSSSSSAAAAAAILTNSVTSPQKSKVDRQRDPIYKCTTNVVRAIMTLSSGVEKSNMGEYLELVKTVGLELRTLLATVDQLSSNFPPQTHK
jgi:focal adhesion kinase 1